MSCTSLLVRCRGIQQIVSCFINLYLIQYLFSLFG
uniref:Uncharacterized protein n=1 Tax=Anguilla anguilla TaxID=7936 RepID=A0A0E9TTX7_ANGAN